MSDVSESQQQLVLLVESCQAGTSVVVQRNVMAFRESSELCLSRLRPQRGQRVPPPPRRNTWFSGVRQEEPSARRRLSPPSTLIPPRTSASSSRRIGVPSTILRVPFRPCRAGLFQIHELRESLPGQDTVVELAGDFVHMQRWTRAPRQGKPPRSRACPTEPGMHRGQLSPDPGTSN